MTKRKTASKLIDKACNTMVRGPNIKPLGIRESGYFGLATLSGNDKPSRNALLRASAGWGAKLTGVPRIPA